jgi:uncharacterized membrane protein (UPF0127 family)
MSFLAPVLKNSAGAYRLENDRNGRILADQIATAFDSKSRRRGLLGRDGLPGRSALIIAPTNAIHTFFMRFAIDVAFISKDGRVVKTYHALRPWRIAGALRAQAVIELPTGALVDADLQPGDRLRLAAGAFTESADNRQHQ